MIPALLFVALAAGGPQDPRPGVAALREAEQLAGAGNPEEARARVDLAIAEMLAARPEAVDAEDDRVLRDAGALAYRLRSMESAHRAWDAVRRYRERTLEPASLELQNARGNLSWIGEQMGLVAEARALEEQVLAALAASLPPDHDALQMARANLGDTLLLQGEPARAAELFQAVADVRRAKLPAGNPQRLRAEIDLACGRAGVGAFDDAARVLERIAAEAAPTQHAIRVRAAAALAIVRAARGAESGDEERRAFAAAVLALESELAAACAAVDPLPWRDAEVRRAELGPFLDLLASARLGFGVPSLVQPASGVPRSALEAPASAERLAVYRRWERSRIEGAGVHARWSADERLAAQVCAPGVQSWIDLGPASVARDLVKAWDAAAERGDALAEAAAVAKALFEPVARAAGDPNTLAVVPDDVVWSLPLAALGLRSGAGRAIAVEAVLHAPRRGEPGPAAPWAVLGDPATTSEAVRKAALAVGPVEGGGASAFVSSLRPSSAEATAAWGRRLGVEPARGDAASVARFAALSMSAGGVVLTAPVWSAPDDVPRSTEPRPLLGPMPLAAAMAREDVYGGSSPADLCGFLFTDFAAPPGENQRVPAAPRAADLRESHASIARRLVVASPPPRADVLLRARDVEALARALVAAGYGDLCFAVKTVRDVERAGLPTDLEAALPRAQPAGGARIPGPWLRVRAIP